MSRVKTHPRRSRSTNGFTLVEVIVALVILAGLTILTAQAIRSGLQTRKQISTDISRESQLADALRIMRNDIGSAFHYRDIFVTMMNEIETQASATPAGGGVAPVAPTNPSTGPTPRETPIPTTGFIGETDSLYFTTLSNARTAKDAQESDQAKIGYYLKSCTTQNGDGKEKAPSKCLMRAITPLLDADIDKPGAETILVDNVEDFKLRYIGPNPGHDPDFVDTWKTGPNGDSTTRDNFPYAVEITLTLHNKNDPKDKPVTGVVLAPIRFTNNPQPSASPGQGATQSHNTPIPGHR